MAENSKPGADARSVAPTVGRLLRDIAENLEDAGVPGARVEARRILVAAGLSAECAIGNATTPVSEPIYARSRDIARRRAAREPLSRIMGEREFYGRVFKITPATLDPRPDSETLVEAALDIVREEGWEGRPLRVLDIGTGSGCLLTTLLAELPLATGLGTDIDREALSVAEANARRLGVAERARFEVRRSVDGVSECFDLIVTNPPYVRTGDIATLMPEVRSYDPRLALDGGPDGLDIYREISRQLARVLPEGWALFEVGAGQSDAVRDIVLSALASAAVSDARVRNDLGGHARCVAIRTRR